MGNRWLVFYTSYSDHKLIGIRDFRNIYKAKLVRIYASSLK
jgi:hypothetical protein